MNERQRVGFAPSAGRQLAVDLDGRGLLRVRRGYDVVENKPGWLDWVDESGNNRSAPIARVIQVLEL